jgi:hypothetical protein
LDGRLRLELRQEGAEIHAQKAEAAAFAANVKPIIESLRASGVCDLRGLALALNNRGVGTARGGRWHVPYVKNLIDRSPT